MMNAAPLNATATHGAAVRAATDAYKAHLAAQDAAPVAMTHADFLAQVKTHDAAWDTYQKALRDADADLAQAQEVERHGHQG